ncbi:MAG: cyanophycinase, partial [Syntrophomonadaceae bacterium]
MRRTSLRRLSIVACLVALGCAHASPRAASSAAPAAGRSGTLLIVGGGPIPDALIERFVALSGGAGHARILVLPMASEDADAGEEIVTHFRSLGAWAERLVLTRDEADTEGAAQRLAAATGVWFGGGDQSRLTAVLKGTRAEAAIEAVYRGGGVVGGTSAGAAVMSTPMITGDERRPGGDRPPSKDSSDAFMTIARDDVVTRDGFGLLPGAIVDQHFVRRRRH